MSGSIPAARAAVPQRSRASTARREVIAVASDVDAQPEHDGAQVEVAGAASARAAHESVEGEACAGERSDKVGLSSGASMPPCLQAYQNLSRRAHGAAAQGEFKA